MGLLLPLRGHHWVALLWICFVLDTVAVVRLPGVAWSKLGVWEGSALADVWLRSAEYLEFRTCALKSDYYDGGMHRYDENQLFRKGPSGPCWWNGHHLNSSTVAY